MGLEGLRQLREAGNTDSLVDEGQFDYAHPTLAGKRPCELKSALVSDSWSVVSVVKHELGATAKVISAKLLDFVPSAHALHTLCHGYVHQREHADPGENAHSPHSVETLLLEEPCER